jgi:hypothetical protein
MKKAMLRKSNPRRAANNAMVFSAILRPNMLHSGTKRHRPTVNNPELTIDHLEAAFRHCRTIRVAEVER